MTETNLWPSRLEDGAMPTSDDQERERRKGGLCQARRQDSSISPQKSDSLFFTRAGLSSYLYRLCITRVNLLTVGVISIPPQPAHQVSSHGRVPYSRAPQWRVCHRCCAQQTCMHIV